MPGGDVWMRLDTPNVALHVDGDYYAPRQSMTQTG